MIVQCESGHTYENIPVTDGFHDIPKRCHICGAQIANVKLTGSSTISGAGGFAGVAPRQAGLLSHRPSRDGTGIKKLGKIWVSPSQSGSSGTARHSRCRCSFSMIRHRGVKSGH